MKFQHCCRYGQLCCSNVERPFDIVASVYGAKATRSTLSTFIKVDRVEFNSVASVYRSLKNFSDGKTRRSVYSDSKFKACTEKNRK